MWQIAWDILCDTAVYVLAGFAVAGVLHTWFAGSRAIRWLSERGPRSVILATLVGMPLPLCSCSVLPTAVTLRKHGASKGSVLSFLISTPETSVTSILLTYSLLGPLLAIFRPVAACVTALAAGFVENFRDRKADQNGANDAAGEQDGAPDAGGTASCAAMADSDKTPATYREGFRFAFVELFDDIFVWIIVGILAAAAIQAFLPSGVFQTAVNNPLLSMLLALVISVPLYICAESSTPVAAALIAQGLNPGAALVLLLAGPATNIGAIGVLHRELGRATVVVYLTTIAIVSLLAGFVLNMLASSASISLGVRTFDEPLVPPWLKAAGAVAFLLLGYFTIRRRRYWRRLLDWFDRRLPVPVSNRSVLGGGFALAAVLWLASGLVAVQPGEVGVVRRFGRITRSDLAPGLHVTWPYPVAVVDRISVRRVNRMVLGFRAETDPETGSNSIPIESLTLVGDENIANIEAAVHWGADPEEPVQYAYGVSDREELVRSVAQSAVREVIGGRSINRCFTSERRLCESLIEDLLRQRVSGYEAGIRIDSFRFLDTHAPPEVHEAFRDVAGALEDKTTQINLAKQQEAQVIPVARGDGEKLLAEADAYATGALAEARGAAASFLDLVGVFGSYPQVTERRLYFEMLDRVLPGTRKYIKSVGPGAGEIEIWLSEPARGPAPWQAGDDTRQ